jgi:hypothetical protein
MNTFAIIFLGILAVYLIVYGVSFFVLWYLVRQREDILIELFLEKVGKIPSLIEVMRPYVAKPESFHMITRLHTRAMIQDFRSIYDILEHNAKLQNNFLFLMQLSAHIPELQKQEYFLYIRDFIIEFERLMRTEFRSLNQILSYWNTFITLKNTTLIGLLLPGSKRMLVK